MTGVRKSCRWLVKDANRLSENSLPSLDQVACALDFETAQAPIGLEFMVRYNNALGIKNKCSFTIDMKNELALKIESWILKYMRTCAQSSHGDISLLEHRICSAVYVSELSGAIPPSITDIAETLNVPVIKVSRMAKKMRHAGTIIVQLDRDDARIKRLRHDPKDLAMALAHLQGLYDELETTLTKRVSPKIRAVT